MTIKEIGDIPKEDIKKMIDLFKYKVDNNFIVLNNLDNSRTPAVLLLDSLKGSISEYLIEKELDKRVSFISYDEIRVDKHQYPDPFDFLIIDKTDDKSEIISKLKTLIPQFRKFYSDKEAETLRSYLDSIHAKTVEVKSSRISEDENYLDKPVIAYALHKEDLFFYQKIKPLHEPLFAVNDDHFIMSFKLTNILQKYFEKKFNMKFYGNKFYDKKFSEYLTKENIMRIFMKFTPFSEEQLDSGKIYMPFNEYLEKSKLTKEQYIKHNVYLKDIHINTFNYFDNDTVSDEFRNKDIDDISVDDILPYLPSKTLIAGFSLKYKFLKGMIGINNKRLKAIYHTNRVKDMILSLDYINSFESFHIKGPKREFHFDFDYKEDCFVSKENDMKIYMKMGQRLDLSFKNEFTVKLTKGDKVFDDYTINPSIPF